MSRQKYESLTNNPVGLGFWVYLMTDLMLFATLFATYGVLRGNTAGGPAGQDIFSLKLVFAETMILLASSLTAGLALLSAHAGRKTRMLQLLVITGVLGALFLGLEINEFRVLLADGHSWQNSAFLSSYFTLVGTHGLHIFAGLIWLVATVWYALKRPLSPRFMQRLTMFSWFWHFLDLVWVCIFSIVYLMGVLA